MLRFFSILLITIIYSQMASANGWYNDFEVAQLQYSRGANGVHVVFSGGSGNPNPDNCDHSDRFIIAYDSSAPEREKAMLSGISMAYATKNKVKVLLSGCMGGIGGGTYPSVHYLYLQ